MNDTIIQALNTRYATKKFIKGKKVDEEILETIIEAGRMMPTAYGLQPFRIVKVETDALRAKVSEVAFSQPQVTEAGDFFVITRRTDINEAFVDEYVVRIASTRGMNVEDLAGFSQMMKGDILTRSEEQKASWAGRQAYIALGAMIETAALLGVDACPMEGFNPQLVDEVLELPSKNLVSLAFFAVGMRAEGDAFSTMKKVRVERSDIVLSLH